MNEYLNNTALLACMFPGLEVVADAKGLRVYKDKDATFPIGNVRLHARAERGASVNVIMHEGELGRFAFIQSAPLPNIQRAAERNCKDVPGANVEAEIDRLCEHHDGVDMDKGIAILSRHLTNQRTEEDNKYMTVRARNFFELVNPTKAAVWTDDDEHTLQLVLQDMQNLAERLVLINKARAAGVSISAINK